MSTYDVSVILVSFNTSKLTHECLTALYEELEGFTHEVLVVENASRDDSAAMIERDFPQVKLFRSDVNLGFGNANNVALPVAQGRYIVLLNTDAFIAPGGLRKAIAHMDATPRCGMGGGKLIGRDGGWQPSARMFHTVWIDFTVLTGLSYRFPKSKLFSALDRTWSDQSQPASVDWVPGAFAIIRPEALAQTGFFDPAFFLYYEEVDLCYRLKQAGWEIWYWPDIVITHIGGESSRSLKSLEFSSQAAQVVKWRMRSTFLYYRKHHGAQAWLAKWMEKSLYTASMWRNKLSSTPERKAKAERFANLRRLIDQAWDDTKGGRVSPPAPW
ncbi:glycosyltransferase family 2 protein [Granulicella cerasi]|uniref:Glycosyltransferase family 2 protein n=1 Tax=Granulicella cerasi TaxID=741063 RepID=A0ABW1ZBA9_9BACT|nr:glycosyltransferase family 2 protein [Granulicella cerasi]